jgi:hypothetical protein
MITSTTINSIKVNPRRRRLDVEEMRGAGLASMDFRLEVKRHQQRNKTTGQTNRPQQGSQGLES